MKKFVALFLVISFLGMNCATYERGEGINLSPDQKPGAKLIIQKTDGQKVRGELIAVKKNSLLLKEEKSGADKSIDIADIKAVKIVKKSKFLLGTGIGLLMMVFLNELLKPKERTLATLGKQMEAGLVSVIFLPLGAYGGAMAGADKTIQIEGESEAEIEKTFDDLRKKARVPDFQ